MKTRKVTMSSVQGQHGADSEGQTGPADSLSPTRHSAIVASELTPPLMRPVPAPVDAPIEAPGFELRVKLGSGGFGEVWLARHRLVGNYRAVKLIPPSHRAELDGLRILLQRIPAHPSLCPILAVGEVGDWLYCVMPLADNAITGVLDPDHYQPRTLTHHLARSGKLNDDETANIGVAIVEGLMHLHRHGAVHGDVKPANVICIEGGWRITDYGLLSGLESPQARGLTRGFAPPEGPGSPKADQHALGVTLYVLKTGRDAVAFAREREIRPLAPDSSKPRTLDDIIWKAAAADPGARYASMEELRDELLAVEQRLASADRKRGLFKGRAMRRLCAAMLGALFAFIVMDRGGDRLLAMTGIHEAYSGWLRGWAPPFSEIGLDRVSVIALQDNTDIDATARNLGLTQVSAANNRSLRALHGALAQRLATSGARVVAFDLYFRTESEFDQEFGAGLAALRNSGVGLVVGQHEWDPIPNPPRPVVETMLIAGASLGGLELIAVGDPITEIWPVLGNQRGTDIVPGFSLAALIAWRQPTSSYTMTLDEAGQSIHIEHFQAPAMAGPRLARTGPPLIIQAGSIYQTTGSVPNSHNRMQGDVSALVQLPPLPPQAWLDDVTIDYGEAILAPPDEMRRRFADKLVIIGDFRAASKDWHQIDTRLIAGAHLQALSCATLLADLGPRTLTWLEMQAATLGVSAIGGLLAMGWPLGRRKKTGSHPRRWRLHSALFPWTTLLCLGGAILAASALVYSRTGLLVSAPALVAALVLAAAAATVLARRFDRSPRAAPAV